MIEYQYVILTYDHHNEYIKSINIFSFLAEAISFQGSRFHKSNPIYKVKINDPKLKTELVPQNLCEIEFNRIQKLKKNEKSKEKENNETS